MALIEARRMARHPVFLLGALLNFPELLPDDERAEAEQHGVDHADHGVNEARDVVVAREDLRPHGAANQQRAGDGERGHHDHEEQGPEQRLEDRHGRGSEVSDEV